MYWLISYTFRLRFYIGFASNNILTASWARHTVELLCCGGMQKIGNVSRPTVLYLVSNEKYSSGVCRVFCDLLFYFQSMDINYFHL